jgi:hypothetical protein
LSLAALPTRLLPELTLPDVPDAPLPQVTAPAPVTAPFLNSGLLTT